MSVNADRYTAACEKFSIDARGHHQSDSIIASQFADFIREEGDDFFVQVPRNAQRFLDILQEVILIFDQQAQEVDGVITHSSVTKRIYPEMLIDVLQDL